MAPVCLKTVWSTTVFRHNTYHGPVWSDGPKPICGWSGVGPTGSVPYDAPKSMRACSTLTLFYNFSLGSGVWAAEQLLSLMLCVTSSAQLLG